MAAHSGKLLLSHLSDASIGFSLGISRACLLIRLGWADGLGSNRWLLGLDGRGSCRSCISLSEVESNGSSGADE